MDSRGGEPGTRNRLDPQLITRTGHLSPSISSQPSLLSIHSSLTFRLSLLRKRKRSSTWQWENEKGTSGEYTAHLSAHLSVFPHAPSLLLSSFSLFPSPLCSVIVLSLFLTPAQRQKTPIFFCLSASVCACVNVCVWVFSNKQTKETARKKGVCKVRVFLFHFSPLLLFHPLPLCLCLYHNADRRKGTQIRERTKERERWGLHKVASLRKKTKGVDQFEHYSLLHPSHRHIKNTAGSMVLFPCGQFL